MTISHRAKTVKNLWQIIFEVQGSIWVAVLPYCLLNCALMVFVELLDVYGGIKIAFSPSGHGFMTLMISFLVVNKVNLTYDRYMNCLNAVVHGVSALRELHQTALVYTAAFQQEAKEVVTTWRQDTFYKICDLLECTMRVVKNYKQTDKLARNESYDDEDDHQSELLKNSEDDPMLYVLALRSHLYKEVEAVPLQLLERMKMVDLLNEFVQNYRTMLKLSSTPLPFPLVQMGRTFLLLWTFSLPFVMRGVVEELYTVLIFIFFLTYGYIGLELVSMKLVNPFGDGPNDINITGMKVATMMGMDRDLRLYGGESFLRRTPPASSDNNKMFVDAKNSFKSSTDEQHHGALYHSMGGGA
ncbi:hypothetical protein ACA910_005734 [Epithemia clementina (nom. ined.)]